MSESLGRAALVDDDAAADVAGVEVVETAGATDVVGVVDADFGVGEYAGSEEDAHVVVAGGLAAHVVSAAAGGLHTSAVVVEVARAANFVNFDAGLVEAAAVISVVAAGRIAKVGAAGEVVEVMGAQFAEPECGVLVSMVPRL